MIDRSHGLPLRRQAAVLQLSRSSLYYEPRPVPAADLAAMRRIDELHLDHPFAGSRMMRDLLRGEGVAIGRERVASMMAADGHRGAVSPAQRLHARTWAQDLPVSAAGPGCRAAEPGVGHGHHVDTVGEFRRPGPGRRSA